MSQLSTIIKYPIQRVTLNAFGGQYAYRGVLRQNRGWSGKWEVNVTDVRYAEKLDVSPAAQRVATVLVDMALASQRDLAGVLGCPSPRLRDPIKELEGREWISSVMMGSTKTGSRPAARWFFTDHALRLFEDLPVTWHEEGNRAVLLERWPAAASFYRAASEVTGLGPFERFLWVDDVGFDAAVQYGNRWVAMFWSGMLHTTQDLRALFSRLSEDVLSIGVGDRRPWPALLGFVVPDQWQRDQVISAAQGFDMHRNVSIWCLSDGSRTDAAAPMASRGGVYCQTHRRETGGWTWESRLDSSIWTKQYSPSLYRAFRLIGEHPGMPIKLCKQELGEGSGGKISERCCRTLVALGLAETIADGRSLRHRLSNRGIDRLARMERGSFQEYAGRALAQSWVRKPERRDHEDLVMEIIGQAREHGLEAIPGWRCYESMGRRGAIAPDGVISVHESTFRARKFYLEVERSARSPSQWRRKLKSYTIGPRATDWPLLVVCWNDNAEDNCQQVGRAHDLAMLTTTIERLEKHGALGTFETWSLYGRKVRIN